MSRLILPRRSLLTGAAALAAHKALAQGVPGIGSMVGFLGEAPLPTDHWTNLSDTYSVSGNFNTSILNLNPRSTKKRYFELHLDSLASSGAVAQGGIGLATTNTSATPASTAGNIVRQYGSGTAGSVLGVAVDFNTGNCYLATNNTFTGDPVAGTGGTSFTIGTVYYIVAGNVSGGPGAQGSQWTARFVLANFSYTPPSGYTAWG